ncbi:MAG: 4-(cytidine 5'-diphospho)-2-C-methyl-D-erythritol kinase [Gemmataceae bacterium]
MDPLLSCSPLAMLVERHSYSLIVRTPAKVNLFLEVLAKRPDGYHEIATLMVTVSLFDTLQFRDDPSGSLAMTCTHPDLSTGPDNLVMRAAQVLKRHSGNSRGAAIRLEKRIPLAAGLAGGSSDAAATLLGLNRLWQLGLPTSQLAQLAGELGSDIPFFFSGPAAWCTGRGEIVEPLPIGRPLFLVLVSLPARLSTAEVYQGVRLPSEPRLGLEMREALKTGDMEALGLGLHNRLQDRADAMCPAIERWLARLKEQRPAGQLMSGSGAAVFALCRDLSEARQVARAMVAGPITEPRPHVQIVRSCV